ncbi:MAG: hypothetical protein WKF73_02785 [Nocardioidaceae bacterium]
MTWPSASGSPHGGELVGGQTLHEVVLRRNDHGERVRGYPEFGELDLVLLADLLPRPSSMGREASEMSVSPMQNFSKAAACAGGCHRDVHVRLLLLEELTGY